MKSPTLIFSLTLLAFLSEVQAHYLWMERDGESKIRVFFGEYQEGLREKSGGRLDEVTKLGSSSFDSEGKRTELKFLKKEDHFSAEIPSKTEVILIKETDRPVADLRTYDIGIVKPIYYTRIHPTQNIVSIPSLLDLDFVPVSFERGEFQVMFKNRPLPKAKVMVYAPNTWMQEIHSDEQGMIRVPTPWPGEYVLEVINKERVAGEFQSKQYEAIRHRATLTFVR